MNTHTDLLSSIIATVESFREHENASAADMAALARAHDSLRKVLEDLDDEWEDVNDIDFFTGDWLVGAGGDRYTVAYQGLVLNEWSGGTSWATSRDIAERLIADQQRLAEEDGPGIGTLRFEGEGEDEELVYTYPGDEDRLGRFGHLYIVPGFSWFRADRTQVDQLIEGDI